MRKITLHFIMIGSYTIFLILFFNFFVSPALLMQIDVRWWADTLAYLNISENLNITDVLIRFDGNFLGPVFIASMMGNDIGNIAIFNFYLFIASYLRLSSFFRLDNIRLFFLLGMSPMLAVSILTLSKEVLGFVALTLFICNLKPQGNNLIRFSGFIAVVFLSFLVRWQQSLIIILFLISELLCISLYSRNATLKQIAKFRLLFLMILTIFLSCIYPYLSVNTDIFSSFSEQVNEDTTRGGTVIVLNAVQQYYFGYVLVVIPKIFLNYAGDCLKLIDLISKPESINYQDLYTNIIIPFQQLITCTIIIVFIYFKRIHNQLNFSDFSVYFSVLYNIVYALSPFIQSRYYFPLYLIFCFDLSYKNIKRRSYLDLGYISNFSTLKKKSIRVPT